MYSDGRLLEFPAAGIAIRERGSFAPSPPPPHETSSATSSSSSSSASSFTLITSPNGARPDPTLHHHHHHQPPAPVVAGAGGLGGQQKRPKVLFSPPLSSLFRSMPAAPLPEHLGAIDRRPSSMPPPPPPPPTAEPSTASTTPDQRHDHDEREAPAVAGEIRPWDRGTNLYVRGLPVYAHREWLFNMCKRYGWITAIKVKMGSASAGCIGSGFVMFETPAEAQRAKQGLMDAGFTVEFAKSIPRCSPKKPATQWSVAFPQRHDYDKQIRITISNLPPSMISKDLFELLLDHDVQFAKIIQNNVQYTGRRSGYAIMATREGALAAVAAFNGHFLPGASQPLEVRLADSEDNSPADISDAHSENEQGGRATEPPVASVQNHHYYDRSSSSSTRSPIASSPEPRGSGRAAHRVDGSTFVPITKQVQLRERGEPEAPTAEGRARHHSSEGNAALGSGEAAAAMARETLNQSEPSAPAMNGPSGDSWNSFYGGAMAMFNILSSQMYGNAMTTGMLLPPTAGGTGDPSQVYSVRKDESQQHDNARGGAAASRLPAMGGGGGGGGDPSLLSVAQPQLSIMPGGMPVHSFGPFGNPGLFSAMGMPVPLNMRGGGPVPQGWPAPPVAYPGIVSAAAPHAAQVQENGYANPSAGQRKSDRTESPRRRRSRRRDRSISTASDDDDEDDYDSAYSDSDTDSTASTARRRPSPSSRRRRRRRDKSGRRHASRDGAGAGRRKRRDGGRRRDASRSPSVSSDDDDDDGERRGGGRSRARRKEKRHKRGPSGHVDAGAERFGGGGGQRRPSGTADVPKREERRREDRERGEYERRFKKR